MDCTHKMLNIDTTTFDWCSLCGIILYHYYPIEPNLSFKQDHLVFEPSTKEWRRRSQVRIMCPENIRINTHECLWFSLSLSSSWCTVCGRLRITKTIRKDLTLHNRTGYLMPVRRTARLKILQESGLIKRLGD